MKPVALIIRDGWGISPKGAAAARQEGNAPLLAKLPFHEYLYKTFPQSRLSASGEDVGLPAGQMGNSEVGHLNLGAGRIVYQELTRINKAIADGTLAANPALTTFLAELKARNGALHLWGLLSDGGVHSHIEHLYALVRVAKDAGISPYKIYHSRVSRRPRHLADGRRGLPGRASGQAEGNRRGENRDGYRALLRDGPRQPLGARRARLEADFPRRRDVHGRHRGRREGRVRRRRKRTSSCPRSSA